MMSAVCYDNNSVNEKWSMSSKSIIEEIEYNYLKHS